LIPLFKIEEGVGEVEDVFVAVDVGHIKKRMTEDDRRGGIDERR